MTATALLEVIEPGLQATVQDFGRFGYLAQGYTRGGPIDEQAFLWANKLVGNHYNATQIEVTMGGFKARALTPLRLVVTGAPLALQIKGDKVSRPMPQWQVISLADGDLLELGYMSQGLRAYIAVAGGFRAPLTKGSSATVVREQVGGLTGNGQPLRAGVTLSGEARSATAATSGQRIRQEFLPELSDSLELEVIPAAQYAQFPEPSQQFFWQSGFEVTDKLDRMGVRLKAQHAGKGTKQIGWSGGSLISEPLAIGAIQVPPDGQPIIMLNDRQTLGGYPKLGVLTWDAKNKLAQARPGTQIRFKKVSVTSAVERLQQVYQFFGVACQRRDNLRS